MSHNHYSFVFFVYLERTFRRSLTFVFLIFPQLNAFDDNANDHDINGIFIANPDKIDVTLLRNFLLSQITEYTNIRRKAF